MLALVAGGLAFQAPACPGRVYAQSAARVAAPVMDETIFEKALAGELEEEGAENLFLSEVGWATFMDKECQASYNLNERPSLASDGYFTADIFSNPADVIGDFVGGIQRALGDPLSAGFMTISNDKSGARSYPKGMTEINARTIKPKEKDFDKSKRIVGIPGYNLFGAPSSKDPDNPWFKIFNE